MHLITLKLYETEFIKLGFLTIIAKKKHYLYLHYWMKQPYKAIQGDVKILIN